MPKYSDEELQAYSMKTLEMMLELRRTIKGFKSSLFPSDNYDRQWAHTQNIAQMNDAAKKRLVSEIPQVELVIKKKKMLKILLGE